MSNKTIIISIIAASILILVGGVALVGRAPRPPEIVASLSANAEATEMSYDWGSISLNGGKVEKTFSIRNSGTGPLEIANVKSSCMCTEAQVTINGEKSPFFGMHASSSWLGSVQPGGTAELLVIFDPAFHGPSGVGQITRVISLETNDPKRKNLEFTLTANVINN